ncbi:DUF5686 and carboxypeptidase regulatory-like domain-containing protein [Reichenbachiella carrageenanivorans]|uniref:DUF5686 and carboxypeptidase regulatory-like domain-containing protein n=1 Tax=Reichenbachiella carrageenanivorans TaxID=2979869 RepID=A0ABY6D1K8_9BACT|nr:DUF5686 and carboxypeptidase regulatory-like domain-containing protein [Reichenbachiella carrageenanivorans]UXX80003.1 DUF5686 and carboxypeptidase regulatory-like domain-containing protein [Reichenbachiella carrageenanivorans]
MLNSFAARASTLLLLLLSSYASRSQGIKGTIRSANGESLPYATIYVRNLETGTTSNDQGYFEYPLPTGKYDLVFQYLGYQSVVQYVEVTKGFAEVNIRLEPQTIVLKDVEVRAGKEDPAYTIMRKAIAKAKFHQQQLDGYEAEVYIKGSGRLIDSPFFLRKEMAKEGLDSTTAFVTESISKVKYTRPNTYEEKVLSIRSDGQDNNTSPLEYLRGSFYDPMVGQAVSPLSPKAFGYYRFEYLGTFKDRDYEVSKIRVIPRSKGDDLFVGELSIVEDYWSIHSLHLATSYMGINFIIHQIYNPIENKVWLPISHQFDVNGTFFGFEFEYNYLATVKNYQIKMNKDLEVDLVIIDEKVDKELATKLEAQNKNMEPETTQKLQSGKELTRKELRKVLRDYEKLEMKRDTISDVQYITNVTIDSSAYKMDSTFWQAVRPVPLSKYEIKGYQKMDSIALVNQKEAEGDTVKTKQGKEGFRAYDLLLGNTYKLGDKSHLELKPSLLSLNFNTVEGYNFIYELAYTKTFENKTWLEVTPLIRYGFSIHQLQSKLKTTYKFGDQSLALEGGRYMYQINSKVPIYPIINSLTTLMLESNYMKIYQKEFVALNYKHQISDKYRVGISAEYANRIPLENQTNHTWFNQSDKMYTPNAPINVELGQTNFVVHQAFLTGVKFSMKPWQKYYIKNNEQQAINHTSPEITVAYDNAIPLADAEISFHRWSIEVEQSLDVGIRGRLNYRAGGGGLLAKDSISFLDYNHFMGNRTPVQDIDVVKSFRLLPYYNFSTSRSYFNLLTHYQFRKLFLSRFKFARKRGVKESVFVNYLGTESSLNYAEAGYSIDNIFRLFRIEGVAAFQDGVYLDWGIRFGVAAYLEEMFDFE